MFVQMVAEIGKVQEEGFSFGDTHEAIAAIRGLESARRKLASLAVELHAELDRSLVFRDDGHASAKVMVRHVGRLAASEAAGRERQARMARWLPEVSVAFAAGEVGVAQFDLLGRVYANPRVRRLMVDAQGWFIEHATRLSYADFETAVREWERLADMDGAAQRNQRSHENRNIRLVHDRFDLSWGWDGSMGCWQGAGINEIYQHYIAAERLADWDAAKAVHGDAATDADLPRTEPQRRADALARVFSDAAAADGSAVPADFCHDIVWSEQAYEAMLAVLDADDPTTLADVELSPEEYRCETLDGVPLEPVEAAACSLVAKVRRVVVDAAGTVTDLGRARTFTRSARKAVQLQASLCDWPGCCVPVTQCQIDHRHDHAQGGPTNPANGGPFCGRHNRLKQQGFTVWRDPTGHWHIQRPDGTEIE